jgi:hypothetical protein
MGGGIWLIAVHCANTSTMADAEMVDLTAPEAEEVWQTCLNGKYRPQQLMEHLQQQISKGTVKWKHTLKPVWEGGQVKLLCLGCGKRLAPANPAQTAKGHARCQQQQAMDEAGQPALKRAHQSIETSAGSGSSSGRSGSGTMDAFVNRITPQTEQMVLQDLGMFFFTSQTPFIRINNPHLRQMFQRLGIRLPSDTTLRTTMLNAAYEREHQAALAKVQRALVGSTQQAGHQNS